MTQIDSRYLLRKGCTDDTLGIAYEFNRGCEVYITMKKEIADMGMYCIAERRGQNIKLTMVEVPDSRYWEPRRNGSFESIYNESKICRKIRLSDGRSPSISLPKNYAKPGQLFRVIRSKEEGIVWLLRIGLLSYAEETSVPKEFLENRIMSD